MGDLVRWVLVILGLLLLATALVVVLRLRALDRRVGSFACAVVTAPAPTAVVRRGVAHYGVGRLDWWQRRSLGLRPDLTWSRDALEVRSRELLPGSDDRYRVECGYRGEPLVLEMSVAAYAGLTSWLESAPPSTGGAVS